MFYRENLEHLLEMHRDNELRAVCRIIYNVILTVVTRRHFLKAKKQIVQVQKFCKVSALLMRVGDWEGRGEGSLVPRP